MRRRHSEWRLLRRQSGGRATARRVGPAEREFHRPCPGLRHGQGFSGSRDRREVAERSGAFDVGRPIDLRAGRHVGLSDLHLPESCRCGRLHSRRKPGKVGRQRSRRRLGRRARQHRRYGSVGSRRSRGFRRHRGRCDRVCRRRQHRPRRQQCQRVDIALRIARHAHPEVHEGRVALHITARADRPNGGALLQRRAARNPDRAEMDKRRREPGRRLDRDRLPAAWDRARERDDTVRRREHGRAAGGTEVDATVLAGCVRVGSIEQEGPEHRPFDGPRPASRGRHRQRAGAHDQDSESPHNSSFVARFENDVTVTRPLAVVNTGYKVRR